MNNAIIQYRYSNIYLKNLNINLDSDLVNKYFENIIEFNTKMLNKY